MLQRFWERVPKKPATQNIPSLEVTKSWLKKRFPEAYNATLESILEHPYEGEPAISDDFDNEIQEAYRQSWNMKVKILRGREFTESISPALRAAFWLGFKQGYLAEDAEVRSSTTHEEKPISLRGRQFESYQKGFEEGAHYWVWMWNGM